MNRRAVLIGTAKLRPWPPRMVAVFTPTTSPRVSRSGPPELPGLSAASVCDDVVDEPPRLRPQRAPERAHHARRDRCAEAERVADRDHSWPARRCDESPSVADAQVGRGDLRTARSVSGSLADEVRGASARPSGSADVMPARAVHHVAVGEDSRRGRRRTRSRIRPARRAAPALPGATSRRAPEGRTLCVTVSTFTTAGPRRPPRASPTARTRRAPRVVRGGLSGIDLVFLETLGAATRTQRRGRRPHIHRPPALRLSACGLDRRPGPRPVGPCCVARSRLLYFWTVVREAASSRAAEKLRLSQPTISSQVRALEDVLGEKLFTKVGRRLVPTDVGRVVYPTTDEIFSLGRELMDTVKRPTGRCASTSASPTS